MSKYIKVAIVEDDEYLRHRLGELVDDAENLKLVGTFKDGSAALEGIPLVRPDVVIMDIQLPGIDGVECVRRLKATMPQVNFLMLTAYEDSDRVFESLKVGASGYLLKRTSLARLLEGIEELHAGGSPMTPQIARQVVQFISNLSKSRESDSGLTQLTPGERKTLDELAQGYAYKEIADHLGITVHGVRHFIRKIYEKLHVHSRSEAIIKYLNR